LEKNSPYQYTSQTKKCCEVKLCNTVHLHLLMMIKKCVCVFAVISSQDDSRPECEEGWKQHGAECYYFSTNKSTWGESSRACSCRGGTLVRIGSREEQEYLEGELRRNHARGKFWIGLTDLKKEGTWLWTDVSPLDPRFDGNRAVDLKCWFDQLCSVTHGHICDKPAQTSRSKCV
uniref:C-type lectin domain-containing protein n=1 Tax=Cyclopterus lumpus TaxID=8103 RepID=A0A8C2XRA3_CYCLU